MKADSKSAVIKNNNDRLFLDSPSHLIAVVIAIMMFIFLCSKIDLTQDDAYISFRYAANLLSGHGLVYNIGERVEGYTNFLWIILLAVFKQFFDVDFITFAKVAGVICGSAIFILLYILLKHHTGKGLLWIYIMIVIVLLSNLAIPYWSTAGLETSAFSCMILLALVAEYRWERHSYLFLIISSLLRPEGVIVFGIIILNRIIIGRMIPWRSIIYYSIFMSLFALFKLLYYGSLFPNPYYAKSGVGLEYIMSGLDYTWFFARTTGVYGLIFFIPVLMLKKLWKKYSLLYLFVFIYTIYIIWVGGDVLRAYRFFFPVIPVLIYLFVVSVVELVAMINIKPIRKMQAAFIMICVFSYLSYSSSASYIWQSRDMENGLNVKMNFISTMLKQNMKWDFSIAASTIGILGYQLMGHRVIDMLGLTEPNIARNPETISGISSSWKERRFNSRYLLEQQPDFILFATDMKPSAPAEKALMLHSEFRNKYTPTGFLIAKSFKVIWQKKRTVDMSKDIVCSDILFIDKYIEGCPQKYKTDKRVTIASLAEAQSYLEEEYGVIDYLKGYAYRELNMEDSAMAYYKKAVALDSLYWPPRYELAILARDRNDIRTYAEQLRIVMKQCPWMFRGN